MPLVLSFFTGFTVYGIATPYLSVLVRGLGYDPALVGLLLGLFEIAGIAGPFLLGRLSDRLGCYRPPLLVAVGLILVSLPSLALFRHPLVSAASLVVMAVGLRSFIPLLDAHATLALGPSGDYGRVRTVGSLSFVAITLFLQFTPILAPNSPTRIAIWIAITGVSAFFAFSTLPDQNPSELRHNRATYSKKMPAERRRNWDAAFIIGLVMIALSRLAMAPIASFFSLFLVESLKWNAVGLMWAISAGSEIPIMFLSARLIRRFGAPRLLAVSVLAVALRLSIYALFPHPVGAVAGQLLHSICYGLFHPAGIAFISTRVPPERRAIGMAMYLSLGTGVPTFLGSSIGGFIVGAAGYRVLFASFIPFAIAGFVLYLTTRKVLESPIRA